MRIRVTVVFLTIGVLLFAHWLWPHGKKAWPVPKEARELKNPIRPTDNTRTAGGKIYVQHCASCHGSHGDGRGPMAARLKEQPAGFTDAHMMGEMTDGEIFWKITEGRDPMPSFKKLLADEQRWQLVHHLRSFAQGHHGGHERAKK